MTPRKNHEKRREEIKTLFYSQSPARLNDQICAVKKRMRQRVIRYERPGVKIVLQRNGNTQQQEINGVDSCKPVREIFCQPLASQLRLLIVDAHDEKAAQRKEKCHDVENDMCLDPRRKMVEKNDGGTNGPDACQ